MNNVEILISDAPLSWHGQYQRALCGEYGAVAQFVGIVRNHNHDRLVKAVEYDIFAPLAQRVLEEICHEAKKQWGEKSYIYAAHRYGKLTVGEASVAIVAATPHREEAFAACRYVIEQIKLRAPIWKKEHYDSGESEWVKGHSLCQHATGH